MPDDPRPVAARRVVTIWLSLAAAAAGITMLFMGMRAVMDIGGVCASGASPFPISRPCPTGAPLLVIGGIWLGIIGAVAYVFLSLGAGIPSLAGLLWPALFLALGWNFLEYAFAPPVGTGPVWGWLIPGVLFVLMGGVPLWFVIQGWRDGSSPVTARALFTPPGVRTITRVLRPRTDRIAALGALDAAYQAGALDAEAYERAKRKLEGSS